MINSIFHIGATPLKQKKTNSFCQNSKSNNSLMQTSQQNPIQSLSSEHARANFYPINKISFGNVLTSVTPKITSADVVKRLNEQLNIIPLEKIHGILDSFNDSVKPLAARILQKLTQFGNMESLNEIAKHVIKKNKGIFYARPSQYSLMDMSTVMGYLAENKKTFIDTIGDVRCNGINSTNYILDKVALEELETNKNHLEEIKNNPYVKIIYPEGWINGLNPFNQTENVREKVRKLIPRVKLLQAEKGIKPDKAISAALNEEITERIKELGLEDKFEIIRNPKARNVRSTAGQISKQLAPASMKEEDLEQVVNNLPSYSKQIMLDYLLKNADVYSPRRLSICLKKLHDKFQRKSMLGDGTYYYVPAPKKSYGIIAMMYKLANNIPNDRFIYDVRKIPPKAKRIIILDDIAGSGDQINSHKNTARDHFFRNITIAPVLSTNTAAKRFSKNPNKTTFCPYRIKDELIDSAYFKSLKGYEQNILLEEMEGLGFSSGALSVVFPYMGPDNNNLFFAKNIAPKFTLNGKGVEEYQNVFKYL